MKLKLARLLSLSATAILLLCRPRSATADDVYKCVPFGGTFADGSISGPDTPCPPGTLRTHIVTRESASSSVNTSSGASRVDQSNRAAVDRPVSSSMGAGYSEQANQNPFKGARCSPVNTTARHRTPVDLYGSLAACIREGNYDIAIVTSALAGAYGRFDSYRVADESAHDVVGILKDAALLSAPNENREAYRAAGMKVVNDPEKLRELCKSVSRIGYPLYEPTYMQNHGLAAIVGSTAPNSSASGIADSREMWRKALLTYLNCP